MGKYAIGFIVPRSDLSVEIDLKGLHAYEYSVRPSAAETLLEAQHDLMTNVIFALRAGSSMEEFGPLTVLLEGSFSLVSIMTPDGWLDHEESPLECAFAARITRKDSV